MLNWALMRKSWPLLNGVIAAVSFILFPTKSLRRASLKPATACKLRKALWARVAYIDFHFVYFVIMLSIWTVDLLGMDTPPDRERQGPSC